MKILAWNIRHGGGTRLARIFETIVGHDPDVVVLTEFQPGPGKKLVADLKARGWSNIESTSPAHRFNGVLVASRANMEMRRQVPAVDSPTLADRWLEVHFRVKMFSMAALYLPTSKEELVQSWELIHEVAERRRGEHFLFLGDFNTGYTPFDAENGSFSSERYFCGMPMRGFSDAWRCRNGRALEYTWYSHTKIGRRNGFRIDHAFASTPMLRRIRECRYSHVERESGVSDHSSLLVRVR